MMARLVGLVLFLGRAIHADWLFTGGRLRQPFVN
jgi:hypothetical protein